MKVLTDNYREYFVKFVSPKDNELFDLWFGLLSCLIVVASFGVKWFYFVPFVFWTFNVFFRVWSITIKD
jgi:hypothetical protein